VKTAEKVAVEKEEKKVAMAPTMANWTTMARMVGAMGVRVRNAKVPRSRARTVTKRTAMTRRLSVVVTTSPA
jgi:hypothetical protein